MVSDPIDETGSGEPGFLFLLIDPVEDESDAEAITQDFEERPAINYFCFQKGKDHYLLLWSRDAADLDTAGLSLPPIIKPLALANRRKRQIRSIIGIFKLVIEIFGEDSNKWREDVIFIARDYGEGYPPGYDSFFWLQIKSVLKQNKKDVLINFLFESDSTE